jgi:hypothetical protein
MLEEMSFVMGCPGIPLDVHLIARAHESDVDDTFENAVFTHIWYISDATRHL